jgi:hypothetical protein
MRFIESMRPLGIATRNMDPLADFAEVIVAREFNGELQGRANKDVDVVTAANERIQVKSLRVSSDKPKDNWLNWRNCTRRVLEDSSELPLIGADILSIVVYLDSEPYVLLSFPVRSGVRVNSLRPA